MQPDEGRTHYHEATRGDSTEAYSSSARAAHRLIEATTDMRAMPGQGRFLASSTGPLARWWEQWKAAPGTSFEVRHHPNPAQPTRSQTDVAVLKI